MNANQHTELLPSRLRIHRLAVTLLATVATAALTACGGSGPTTATAMAETAAPLSHTYAIESNELVEISPVAGGSMRTTPTGWIVPSATTSSMAASKTLAPRSHSYSIESSELVEVSQFPDGSMRYTPTGWIVPSRSAAAKVVATPTRQ